MLRVKHPAPQLVFPGERREPRVSVGSDPCTLFDSLVSSLIRLTQSLDVKLFLHLADGNTDEVDLNTLEGRNRSYEDLGIHDTILNVLGRVDASIADNLEGVARASTE